MRNILGRLEGFLESSCHDQSHHGSGELTNALHGKDGAHHGTTPLGACKPVPVSGEVQEMKNMGLSNLLRGDDGGQRVISADPDAHNDTPKDENSSDRDGGGGR